MNFKNIFYLALTILFIVAGVMLWRKGGKILAEDLNPTSEKNLAYRGANKIVQTLTNDPHATLGTKIFDAVDATKKGIGRAVDGFKTYLIPRPRQADSRDMSGYRDGGY